MSEQELVMLCDKDVLNIEQATELLKNNPEWKKELKADGDRYIWVDGLFINRRGYKGKYPHIKINNNAVVDGEICFFTEQKKGGDFNLGRRKVNWDKTKFLIFDILEYEGMNLRELPLKERVEYLKKITGENIVLISDIKVPEWNEIVKENYEGWILKDLNSPYVVGRNKYWLKIKAVKKEVVRFNSYEINPDNSITITNGFNRCKVGRDIEKVKNLIDLNGEAEIVVNYLEKEITTGHLRMITYNSISEVKK